MKVAVAFSFRALLVVFYQQKVSKNKMVKQIVLSGDEIYQ